MIFFFVAVLFGCTKTPELTTPRSPGPEKTNIANTPSKPPYQRFESVRAIEAFQKAGLEVANTRPMTREDYGLAPLVAVEGSRFFIPSLGDESGGRVLSFSKPEDLAKTKAYYDSFARESAAFFSHIFVKDNLLIQINGELPDDKAAKYNDALQALN